MAILTCAIPHFALGLVARGDATVLSRPLALVGAEERVVDVSEAARGGRGSPLGRRCGRRGWRVAS